MTLESAFAKVPKERFNDRAAKLKTRGYRIQERRIVCVYKVRGVIELDAVAGGVLSLVIETQRL